ncbi:MAG TPA: hypothetical protein VK395_22095 [Gemmataceae bacterium]|nr:hypothetical protein [Gemmataceae bacterium]
MNQRIAIRASLALVLLGGSLWAAERLKSGPQTGEQIPGPFHPLNVTGDSAGSKACQV